MSPLSYFLRYPSRLRRRARRSRTLTMLLALLIPLTLLAPFYIIYKPPHLLIRYFQYRWPDVLWHVPTSKKMIALTIDDAPSEYTQEILQVLREEGASATFFVIGAQVAGREEVLSDIVRQGSELGNHAMRDQPSRGLSDEQLAGEIRAVETMVGEAYAAANVTQEAPKYFRPGSGFFSERMRVLVAGLGYQLVLGGIYPHDPQVPFWRVNARHVLSMARPGGVIVCHDRRAWTVGMLRRVVAELKRRGFRVVGVGELLRETG